MEWSVNNTMQCSFLLQSFILLNLFQTNVAGNALVLRGREANGASAVGVYIETENTFSTSGAKILMLRTGSTQKAYFVKDGGMALVVNTTGFANGLFIVNSSGTVSTSCTFALTNTSGGVVSSRR